MRISPYRTAQNRYKRPLRHKKPVALAVQEIITIHDV
jgi:hypothetical protein